MAFTVSHLGNTVVGNKRVRFIRVTADAATDAIDTGLTAIDFISTAFQSATTGGIKFDINALSAGTASNGKLAITGAVSGDEIFVTVWGR